MPALWNDFAIDDETEIDKLHTEESDYSDDEETFHFETIALYHDEDYSKSNKKGHRSNKIVRTIGGGILRARTEQKTMVRSISCILLILVLAGVIAWTTETKLHGKIDKSKVDQIMLDINEACSEKNIYGLSATKCKDLCKPHACCWDSEIYNNNLDCMNDLRKNCTLYEPCQTLIKHRKPKIKPPPDDINELCALTDVKGEEDEKVLIDIDDACRKACLPGECCLETSQEVECFSQNEEVCTLYETPCSHIPPDGFISDFGGKLPPIPNSMSIACAPDQSNAELIEICNSVCNEALCCIGKGNLANCAAEESHEECEEYKEFCLDVWPDSDIIEIPDSAIDTLCSDEIIKTKHGMDECHRICFLGSCCWDENETGNCYKGNEYICDKYSPCVDIFRNKVVGFPIVPIPISDLEIMCGSNALVSFPVLQNCIQSCSLGACCFGYGKLNCASENADACLKYKPCQNLPLFNQPQNAPMSPLEVICSPDLIQTVEGFATCSAVCEPGACCNDAFPHSCYAQHSDACEEYEPCRSIKVVPPPPPDLYDKCSSQNFANEELLLECVEACRSSMCCFEDGYGNCKANNVDVCSQYSLCLDIPEVEHDENPIAKLCSPESLGTRNGRKECLTACQGAWCCISEGEGNCVDDKPDFCFEYIPFCKDILLNAQFNVDDIDDPLIITCSKQNIVTKAGKSIYTNNIVFRKVN